MDKENNLLPTYLFGYFMANDFNPQANDSIFPKIPTINQEEYNNASEEEKRNMVHKAIEEDAFWGKLFKKIKNKENYDSFIKITKDIDTQIAELSKKRWKIIEEWVNKV